MTFAEELFKDQQKCVSKVAKKVKNNFESVKVETKTKRGKTGRSISVRNSEIRIETGDEDEDLAFWIKKSLER